MEYIKDLPDDFEIKIEVCKYYNNENDIDSNKIN